MIKEGRGITYGRVLLGTIPGDIHDIGKSLLSSWEADRWTNRYLRCPVRIIGARMHFQEFAFVGDR
jgi:hypothetical protein